MVAIIPNTLRSPFKTYSVTSKLVPNKVKCHKQILHTELKLQIYYSQLALRSVIIIH